MSTVEVPDKLVKDAGAIFEAGLRSVRADRLLRDVDWTSWTLNPLTSYRRIVVVGMGKASMAMAGEIEAQLGDAVDHGAVVVPEGHPDTFPADLQRPRRVEILEASHPVPDVRSAAAARRMIEEARQCGPDDLLLVLISGGGSSLCAGFAGDISLDDARETFRLLLESGADIHAMNTVRRHISTIGGGRLAESAGASDVLAVVVSDVVGDDLSVIASGPTVPDSTTASDAVDMLRRFDLWRAVPERVRAHLRAACDDLRLDTPDERSRCFERVVTKLLGSNRWALEAAAAESRERGYLADVRSRELTGEAREIGKQLVREMNHARSSARAPTCLLWGGETTVTVRGDGKGGRNQELALAAAMAMDEVDAPFVLLSAGTDGRDGPTPAAGAHATPASMARARERSISAQTYLDRNDAYHFWKEVGGLIVTGPTHTNVMDLQVALIGSRDDINKKP